MFCFLRLCKSFYIVDDQAICIKLMCTFRKTKTQLLISHILRYQRLKVAISPSSLYVTSKQRDREREMLMASICQGYLANFLSIIKIVFNDSLLFKKKQKRIQPPKILTNYTEHVNTSNAT